MTAARDRLSGLRVEHLDERLGITLAHPRLSWQLPNDAAVQVAYQIQAGDWDTGRVESSQSLLVPYAGPDLEAGSRIDWRVRVWSEAGESEWSEWAWWEPGLLSPADWIAEWIQPAESEEVAARALHPGYLLRGSFVVDAPISHARLYATAHGTYELFANGERIGDMELMPGFTSYHTNLQVQTFDVSDVIRRGENAIGAIVTDGWFRGQTSAFRLARIYGDRVALLAQLDVHLADGTRVRFGTGSEWRSCTSAIVSADLFAGEVVDFAREQTGWDTAGYAVDGWSPVDVCDYALTNLGSSVAPPVRRTEEVRPVSVTRLPSGRHVVDLGQNINGWIRLDRLGPEGTTAILTHGEALGADGDLTLDHLVSSEGSESFPWDVSNWNLPFQEDRVTSAGKPGQSFEPRHTTHGFRYVRVEGLPDLSEGDVVGMVVHSDLRRTGWFECSDERINKLHEAAVWSFRGNACDVPTDCPTRECAGWTGDWQIFVGTAALIYDVAGFSTKWLRDLAADQRPDGCVPHWIPDTLPQDVADNPIPFGSAGWGDAAVIVPWEIYRAYGDVQLLEEQWPSMMGWVEYAARAAAERGNPYIWDGGFHFGEWLEPGEAIDNAFLLPADQSDVATAYLHHSSTLLSRIAAVLGRTADLDRYRKLAERTRAAWQAEFITPLGTLARDTQASHVRALAFDLVPAELRPRVLTRLVELIRQAGTHVGTGFLATPYLLPVLAENGHLDAAYELLLQDTEPSWLTMIERGATTIWELWDGLDARGTPRGSLNHYSKGAVIAFLYRYTSGIGMVDEESAYRRFRITPKPGGGLTSAKATYDSPYGRIESAWRATAGEFALAVTVPPGTRAEIELPDGSRHETGPGRGEYRCRALGGETRPTPTDS